MGGMKTVKPPVFCDICGEKVLRNLYILPNKQKVCNSCLKEAYMYEVKKNDGNDSVDNNIDGATDGYIDGGSLQAKRNGE